MLFIFLLPEQKKNETKRKFAVCIFLPTPVLFSAKEKELATLKQLFLFNAPKSTSASRQKKEAGTRHFQSLITHNSKLITQKIHFPLFQTAWLFGLGGASLGIGMPQYERCPVVGSRSSNLYLPLSMGLCSSSHSFLKVTLPGSRKKQK